MRYAAKLGVIATKGGSGKSTLVSHVASEAARDGFNVLVVDCDQGQGSLTQWAEAIRCAANPVVVPGTYETVAACIAEGEREGFDFIFVDTPAGNGQLVNKVASLVEHILIPLRGTTFDLLALRNTIDLLETTVDVTNPKELREPNSMLKAGIVLNGLPARPDKLVEDIKGALRQRGAGSVEIVGMLRERAAYSTALAKGLGVTEHGRDAEAAQEIAQLFKKIRKRARAREKAIADLQQ